MEVAVSAARWVVSKALAPVTDGVLEAWAASQGLGSNVDALKVELLYAQAMLDNAHEREIRSPALKQLLHKLRQLAYDADDVLDELDYFRIQDELDGTHHAADEHPGGCIDGLRLHARHTARAVAAKLNPSSGSRDKTRGEHDDEQDDDTSKQGCLSSICSCGRQTETVDSSPASPTNTKDDHKDNCDGNGRQSFCGALSSKVHGCLSGACLCGSKRDTSSSLPSQTNQCNKKVGFGCLRNVTSTACNAAQSIGKRLLFCSFQSGQENVHTGMSETPNMPGKEQRFVCGAWMSSKVQERKNTAQEFNRAVISAKMKDITEHLKPVCAKVSNILSLEFMGSNRITKQDIAKKRHMTTPDIMENRLYGRDIQKKRIVDRITLTHGEYSANELVVLPIVGPGGIGKTTFTQHVYDEVQSHFQVAIWICVSLNFNASRLAQEAVKQIPKVDGEEENSSDQKIIEQRLKAKRFLLVLDDIWECHEDEWTKLLAPFAKGGEKGNVVIVTTRFPKVAKMIIQKQVDCQIEDIGRLEGEDFMSLFEACVFGNQQPWKDCTELREVGVKIASKLKGFPLAAKTVGRLLRNQLITLENWNRVLESKEWELQTDENDIMPALKLSYDYLPFHLQQCFYYCALFPEDYEFESKELVHFWIGLDIVHPCEKNRRIEDVDPKSYLNDLVDHGFVKMNKRNDGHHYYVVHDLLHNLAVNISSFECLSIHSSNVKSIQIHQDVRHLSIIVDNKDVEDIKTFKYYKNDLSALDKRFKVEKLRTLMVFGEHHRSFVKIFCNLFEKARALRAIYLSGGSYLPGAPYTMKDMLCNFSKLTHLRYLRISAYMENNTDFFNDLSRLYHLEIIHLQECRGRYGLTRHMGNLAKLLHFLVPEDKLQLHSDIAEVGKLKLLQELRSFEVGKESKGFELSQLGQLSQLGGSLAICSLERIQEMEEATEARLIQLKRLCELTLEWDASRPKIDIVQEENALEILIPHNNLQNLYIRGHGGTKCPEWLRHKLSVETLKSLCLDGVAWNIFPPIGDLCLINGPGEGTSSNICDKKFQKLRRLELVNLPRLKKWVVKAPCQLFACLEVLTVKHCLELMELSFSHSTCCQQGKEKEANVSWFPGLQELNIEDCPKLLSFPPVPWTRTLCSVEIRGVGSGFKKIVCEQNYRAEYSLEIEGTDALDSTFWNVLAFDNLTELKELNMDRCPPLPLYHFQMLSSLKTSRGIEFPLLEGESHARYEFLVECMTIQEWGASAKELTQLLTYFPKLSELYVRYCNNITGLGVVEKQATATSAPSSSANKGDDAQVEQHHHQQDGTSGELEIAAEGLLLLPPQLRKLQIQSCRELILRSDFNTEEAGGGQGGLQGLTSLQSLWIDDCPRFLSAYSSSSSSPCFPFPASLEDLSLEGAVGTETPLPLSNLTSLTYLRIDGCGDLRADGLRSLLAQGRLTRLTVRGTPSFFAGSNSESSPPHEEEPPSSSSKLQELYTDDIAGALAAPMWTLLSSSLTDLYFVGDREMERFTEEHEKALRSLTSLERIRFWYCDKLQSLPAGLHSLPNLKKLSIRYCAAIRSLPKDGVPGSLQELVISDCPVIKCLPKECLPSTLQKLKIAKCPAIRSLPKVNDLPSSLRELDVCNRHNSKELRRQCRKLIGTIPIVYD